MDRINYQDRQDNRPGMDRVKGAAKFLFDKPCVACNRRPANGSWMPSASEAIAAGLEIGIIIPLCPACLHHGFDADFVLATVKSCGVKVELPG